MRTARQYAMSGVYHVASRGVNKQNIFLEEADKEFFLELLEKYSKKYNIEIHTHCLLDNHFHLLLKDADVNISHFIQTLTSVYARKFNKKYDRIGHLFQNRFLSEPIEDTVFYKTAFRYILQNPEKAGICRMSEYKWSSYKLYKRKNSFINNENILKYFDSIEEMYKFVNIPSNDQCIDIELRPSEKLNSLVNKIKKLLNSKTPLIPPDLPPIELYTKIRLLKNAGISIRNISRITGIMFWIVANA